MEHSIQKLVVKNDEFYFIASPKFMFMLFLLFGFGFIGGSAKIAVTYGITHWFYACLGFGLLWLVVSPCAFKFEYGRDWGADAEGITIPTRVGNGTKLWKWDIVKEVVVMNSYRAFAYHDTGERGVRHYSKPIFLLFDRSKAPKSLLEEFMESKKSVGRENRLVEEGYKMVQFSGCTQE